MMEILDLQKHLFPDTDKRTVESKTAIIQCFMKIVCEQGPFRISFGEIGRPIEMTRSQVRYHFPDIHSILLASVKYCNFTGQFYTVQRLQKATTPHQQLDAFVHGAFDWVEKEPDQLKILLLAGNMVEVDSAIKQLYFETRDFGLERVTGIVREIAAFYDNNVSESKITDIAFAIQTQLIGSIIDYNQRMGKPGFQSTRESTLKNCRLALSRILFV